MKPGETKPLANTSLSRKILCQRHNRDGLLGLDDRGKKLFESTARINEDFSTDTALRSDTYLFHGCDIERWMLKVFCGLLYSNKLSASAGSFSGWTPPLAWLRILFGSSPFPAGWGLYYLGSVVGFAGEQRVGFAAMASGSDPYALIIDINGLPFFLSMANPPQQFQGTVLEGAIHRPNALCISDGKVEKIIGLGWSGGRTVHMKYTRETPPPNPPWAMQNKNI
jgi:hypothetical protein